MPDINLSLCQDLPKISEFKILENISLLHQLGFFQNKWSELIFLYLVSLTLYTVSDKFLKKLQRFKSPSFLAQKWVKMLPLSTFTVLSIKAIRALLTCCHLIKSSLKWILGSQDCLFWVFALSNENFSKTRSKLILLMDYYLTSCNIPERFSLHILISEKRCAISPNLGRTDPTFCKRNLFFQNMTHIN